MKEQNYEKIAKSSRIWYNLAEDNKIEQYIVQFR